MIRQSILSHEMIMQNRYYLNRQHEFGITPKFQESAFVQKLILASWKQRGVTQLIF